MAYDPAEAEAVEQLLQNADLSALKRKQAELTRIHTSGFGVAVFDAEAAVANLRLYGRGADVTKSAAIASVKEAREALDRALAALS